LINKTLRPNGGATVRNSIRRDVTRGAFRETASNSICFVRDAKRFSRAVPEPPVTCSRLFVRRSV